MNLEQIKEAIDLHELAQRLGWERPHSRGNYRSPHHPDKNPSISIFNDGKRFKDHSSGAAGTCIDAVMFHFGYNEVEPAIEWIRREYGYPAPVASSPRPERKEQSLAEFIADKSLQNQDPAIEYLVSERGIPEATARRAAELKVVGWNDYENPKVPQGEVGHGGPALCVVVRTLNPGHVAAVELRYRDVQLNGGVKTTTQGDKDGAPFIMDRAAFKAARRVVLVESPINAISVEACGMKGTVAMATRGTQTLDSIDWSILRGKEVLIAMDPDPAIEKGPMAGRSPGTEAAWRCYDLLTAVNVSAMMIDQDDWETGKDVNDLLRDLGPDKLRPMLKRTSRWAIPGQVANLDAQRGRARVWLPAKDFEVYGNYRVTPDFSSVMELDKEQEPVFRDLCGFRVAAMSRVTVQSPESTLTGDQDYAPETLFAVVVQTPRHGANLVRRVLTDDQVHNKGMWEKFGPVYRPPRFSRLINIWERAAHIGAVHAVNHYGLAWKKGKLVVNEGPDCYWREPEIQCPYYAHTMPRGTQTDAQRVISAFIRNYGNCQTLMALVWALGAHLKAFTQFWPHFILAGEKSTGKTTNAHSLARAIGMKVFGGATMESPFRQFASICGTFHPVVWEEISNQGHVAGLKAQSKLQDCYKFAVDHWGAARVPMIKCAPVMVVGEDDEAMNNVAGKTVRVHLELANRGEPVSGETPLFPVYDWVKFLSTCTKHQVRDLYRQSHGFLEAGCAARENDPNADRMITNYAAVGAAWYLLAEFAGMDVDTGDFMRNLLSTMNNHISETGASRQPWVKIIETVLSEMARGQYHHPYVVDCLTDGELCLIIRPSHMLDHIRHSPGLRTVWDSLPIRSSQAFKRQLERAGVIEKDGVERRVQHTRYGHLTALSVERLERFGLLVPVE
jgi:hypothetical protein